MNKKGFIISLIFPFITFWFLGLKSPFLYIIAMMFFAFYLKKRKLNNLPSLIIKTLLYISILSLMELSIFGYSYIADYFIRRLFFVSSLVQNYYLYEISNLNDFFYGLNNNELGVTYYIGDKYFHNPSINANTNTFLYFFLKNGFIGYIINVLFIVLIFIYLDLLWLKTNKVELISLSMLFSLLLTEQAFTTVLISSGILLLIIIFSTEKI
ncbi:hypothetical protein [Xenorhabdus szentirmaii]|uniref:hypothetical protein n=1 Tax=Xenorhabdus szentirmaii TaxID=290112 RepID=UPI0019949A90|nr:hypothetical protein [Xenorhabdus sp. CUL]MBD2792783.1 hypothetical protein [Xenorhabdus sp. CUL]